MKRAIFTTAAAALLAVACCGGGEQQAPVKNVIFMIGDGMGLAHVTATMIEQGYAPMAMERAQAVGLVKTYSADNRVTDSGASASAYATGFKCRNSVLSVDADDNPLTTIAELAHEAGKGTGFAVTCGINHATPSAFFTHSGKRSDYGAVAHQLAEGFADVMLGGGALHSKSDSTDYTEVFAAAGYTVVTSPEQLDTLHSGRVAGLFGDGHMPMLAGRWVKAGEERDSLYLLKATNKALEILNNDFAREGFFLVVEGSLIDYGAHDKDTEGLLAEMRDFDRAVAAAFDFADSHPGTLVVVTADHETGGLSIPSGNSDFTLSESGIRYVYGTGSHTGTMVPLFAYGAGAERFSRVMENTEVNRIAVELLGLGR